MIWLNERLGPVNRPKCARFLGSSQKMFQCDCHANDRIDRCRPDVNSRISWERRRVTHMDPSAAWPICRLCSRLSLVELPRDSAGPHTDGK